MRKILSVAPPTSIQLEQTDPTRLIEIIKSWVLATSVALGHHTPGHFMLFKPRKGSTGGALLRATVLAPLGLATTSHSARERVTSTMGKSS